jgi:hypothetical protein
MNQLIKMGANKSLICSFSIKKSDNKTLKELEKLKKYSSNRGISFSYLIIQAIKQYNEQLSKKT